MARPGLRPSLSEVLAELAPRYPFAAPLEDPLALILWENIGYLIDDERRHALFGEFAERVGLSAGRIAGADPAVLIDIARRGGMRPAVRVERWRAIADVVLTRCGGDLAGALRTLPLAKARALLRSFPVIGEPGADKILLFCRIAARPSLESNGVRVLARLGFFIEQRSWAASYHDAIGVLASEGVTDRDGLVAVFLLLREHGRALCRRGAPLCMACPLDGFCAHAVVKQL